ncbi:hypothetical protein CYMTET_39513 [Cymbomonas tetramitiformis]|uniref:Uncharacterized protein n=1 Tax=Cymbomonas tetramitiformis TaxID=36881 RepID=A0AAE0F4K6_9CHLO|nr:hypothetical protein CYMTET_39513 [Cymbomonas tetramitiformis]
MQGGSGTLQERSGSCCKNISEKLAKSEASREKMRATLLLFKDKMSVVQDLTTQHTSLKTQHQQLQKAAAGEKRQFEKVSVELKKVKELLTAEKSRTNKSQKEAKSAWAEVEQHKTLSQELLNNMIDYMNAAATHGEAQASAPLVHQGDAEALDLLKEDQRQLQEAVKECKAEAQAARRERAQTEGAMKKLVQQHSEVQGGMKRLVQHHDQTTANVRDLMKRSADSRRTVRPSAAF